MKTVFKALLILGLMALGFISIFLVYLTVSEFKPQTNLPLQISNQQDMMIDINDTLTLTSFNIGYAALDRDTDFFMDGGTMSRGLSKERVAQNLNQITNFLVENSADIFLVQEVDEPSTRSYQIDQHGKITATLNTYNSSFGRNYKVSWVPVPLLKPMGKVNSGILTMSRFSVNQATRYSLPGEYSWPIRLFQLDRCLVESRLPLTNGQELVIAHIHLSAFDEGGFIRNQQLAFLEEYARSEYALGNYVIIGGDWNHLLSQSPEEKRAKASANWPFWLELLPKDFLTEFHWAFDEAVPSVRTMDAPYNPQTSFTTTIDGFLLSPNLQIVGVETHKLNFEFSDHNPVTLQLRFEHEAEMQEERLNELGSATERNDMTKLELTEQIEGDENKF